MGVQLHPFLTLALDGGEWSPSHTGRFEPRERAPGTHLIGGWVGPRAGLEAVVKRKFPSPCRDCNPLIIQSVAQRYTAELSQLLIHFTTVTILGELHEWRIFASSSDHFILTSKYW
jgi:hypothetical protein